MSLFDKAVDMADMPHSTEAEQAVISALLQNNRVYDDVCDILDADHFYSASNALIYSTAEKMILAGVEANPVSLRERLNGSHELTAVGGWDVIWPILAKSLVGFMGNRTYAETIRNLWTARRLLVLSIETQERVRKPNGETAQEVLDSLEGELLTMSQTRSDMKTASLSDSIMEALSAAEEASRTEGLSGAPTGYEEFDEITGGLEPGTITIIAGRPAMGKTAAGLAIGIRSAKQTGKRTLYWSGEVSKKQMSQRAIASKTGIPLMCIRTGKNRGKPRLDGTFGPGTPLRQEQWDRLVAAKQAALSIPMDIDDTPAISVPKLYSVARRMARSSQGLGLIVVDYLALMKGSKQAQRQGKYAEVSEISADLLAMAKNLNVPIIALQQLNRDVEKRENRRPLGSDLRDSGNLEQDASVIVLLYREEYYLQKDGAPTRKEGETDEKYHRRLNDYAEALERASGKALWIVDKNRQGECRDIEMQFNGPQTWFRGRTEEPDSEAW